MSISVCGAYPVAGQRTRATGGPFEAHDCEMNARTAPTPFAPEVGDHGRYEHREGGVLRIEGQTEAGCREGIWRWYHENGALARETGFRRNRRHGDHRSWTEDGQLAVRGGHERGERVGLWQWFENGRVTQE